MLNTGLGRGCVLDTGLGRGYVLDTSSSSPYFGLFKIICTTTVYHYEISHCILNSAQLVSKSAHCQIVKNGVYNVSWRVVGK